MRVAVVGPGGVGGLLGAVLAKAGNDVVYVATPATAAALNAGGMTLRSPVFGDFHTEARAVTNLTEPVDLCLITVKATALDPALTGVSDLGDGLIVPMLNGVEHMAVLRSRYPSEQVIAGAIRVESMRLSPGVIAHTSPFCGVEIAGDTAPPARVTALAEQLRAAGLDVKVRDTEAVLLWEKIAFLGPFALTTTHADGPAAAIRTERRADLIAVVSEVAAVAAACGAPVDPARIMAMFDAIPPGMTSSMHRDAQAGLPLEIDAIAGSVLRAAKAHGIETPVTTRLVADLSGP